MGRLLNEPRIRRQPDATATPLSPLFLPMGWTIAVTTAVALMGLFYRNATETNHSSPSSKLLWLNSRRREELNRPIIHVFSSPSSSLHGNNQFVVMRQWNDLFPILPDDKVTLQPHVLFEQQQQRQQRQDVEAHCGLDAVTRWDEFSSSETSLQYLATELWKYCSLFHSLKSTEDEADRHHRAGRSGGGAVYVDLSNPQLVRLQDLLGHHSDNPHNRSSVAILGHSYAPHTIHGSLLFLRHEHLNVAANMLQFLVTTPLSVLSGSAVLLPRTLYALIAKSATAAATSSASKLSSSSSSSVLTTLVSGQNPGGWFLLEQSCQMDLHPRHADGGTWADDNSLRLHHTCPSASDFCCSVQDASMGHVVLLNRHPIWPLPETDPVTTNAATATTASFSDNHPMLVTRLPYNRQNLQALPTNDLLYIATIEEEVFLQQRKPRRHRATAGLFDELLRNDCLPDQTCNECLSKTESRGCSPCAKVCGCYCKTLCQHGFRRPVSKRLKVTPPPYSRDLNRFIPRIVHQMWHEALTPVKHPDKSRLAQSFRMSGWEYRFYTEKEAVAFLKLHFPPEVAEAYEDLVSDHLRSDLFRYCVLLIYGGVFSNVDVMLESNLDRAVEPDVGFIAPLDDDVGECVSKSFLGAAPGHPIIAKAIELAVNRVRNRFAQVDVDDFYCPHPYLSTLRFDKSRHTTGACVLGTAVNLVLKRPLQNDFDAGEIIPERFSAQGPVPGRIVLLDQNSNDMGGTRFTLTKKNLLVAVADVRPTPTEAEQEEQKQLSEAGDEEPPPEEQEVEDMGGRYDFEALYANGYGANEDIILQVVTTSNLVAI